MRYDQLCRDREEEHDPQSETAAEGREEREMKTFHSRNETR